MNYGFSSTGKLVADLVFGLESLGHTVEAFFGRGPDPKKQNVHRVSNQSEVLLHVLGTRVTGLTDGFSPFSTKRLIKHFERFAPDVVHLHDIHGYFLNIQSVVNYLKEKRVPTVWTFHSEFMYTGKCGHSLECEKWKTECNNCPDLHGYPKSWYIDFTNKMFHEKKEMFRDFKQLKLIAVSEWLANRMRQSFVGHLPIRTIHNGLDTDIFSPRQTADLRVSLKIENRFVILTVGSNLMSESKGGEWVAKLANLGAMTDIVFVMVGVDKAPKNLPSNVKIIPTITDPHLLAEHYSMADALLLTSSRETFSMVCAESLACGTPVIGFDSGGPPEIAPSGYGRFVPYADLNALESVVLDVKRSAGVSNTAQKCAAFAKQNYSRNIMIKSYESTYKELSLN